MTAPARPPVVHVYREFSQGARYAAFESPIMVAQSLTRFREYLGPYVPRGEIVKEWWEVQWLAEHEGVNDSDNWRSQEEFRTKEGAVRFLHEMREESSDTDWRIAHVVRRKKVRV